MFNDTTLNRIYDRGNSVYNDNSLNGQGFTVYITDNPEIQKTLAAESFLAYQLYDWRVNIEVDGDTIERDIKRRAKRRAVINSIKNNDTIIAIIAPSNYKLLYDLIFTKKNFGKTLKISSWNTWKERKIIKIDEDEVYENFERYLKRGYLSLKLFHELAFYNFTRIEQFFIVLKIAFLNSHIKTGETLGCPIEYEPKIEKNSEYVDLKGIIRVLTFTYRSFTRVIDKLTYHARRGDITDPFSGNFSFLNTKNSLFKIYSENKNTDRYLGIERGSKFLKKHKAGVTYVIDELEKIIPLCDVLKTLRFLDYSNFISIDDSGIGFDVFTELSLNDLSKYESYYDSAVWERVYKYSNYTFVQLFPNIQAILPMFRCPICSVNHFITFPRYFTCENAKCSFYFPRIVKPGGIHKILTELDFLKLLHHGTADIKNARGGYSKYSLYNYGGNKFKAIPVMKDNKAKE